MRTSTLVEAIALAAIALTLEAGFMFHGVVKPLAIALHSARAAERQAQAPQGFGEWIEVQGSRGIHGS
ncbi:MAG TPA: hypothetical protein VML50_05055 [Anaeromyxobacter sp.]|nr:hypothetical protein [Anaeromyxobacter sp.]